MPEIYPDLSDHLAGEQTATILSMDFREAKSSGNPMVVARLGIELPSGHTEVREAYMILDLAGPRGFPAFLRACGEKKIASALDVYTLRDTKAPLPDFETDVLIGRTIQVFIGRDGFITFHPQKHG